MNITSLPENAVELRGDQPVTTSLRVADIFGKLHKNVIQGISALIAECPDEFGRLNFKPSSYINQQGKEQPAYELTRDGFALLVMGFTGREALAFKIAYIERFNAMEAEQRSPAVNGAASLPEPSQTVAHYESESARIASEMERLQVEQERLESTPISMMPAQFREDFHPHVLIGSHHIRVVDLVAMTEAYSIPRKVVEGLLGTNNNNVRQHASRARRSGCDQ